MTIKDICKLTLNDLRNIAVDFDSEYELVSKICGYDSCKLFNFIKHFNYINYDLRELNPTTKAICIPMKDNKHTTLEHIIMSSRIMRIEVNSHYGMTVNNQ